MANRRNRTNQEDNVATIEADVPFDADPISTDEEVAETEGEVAKFEPTFVDELPTVTRSGRKATKWLGVVAKLKEHPGQWAEVHASKNAGGSNSYAQTLRTNHGEQDGVTNQITFASRNSKVYARWNTPEQVTEQDNKDLELAAKRSAAETATAE